MTSERKNAPNLDETLLNSEIQKKELSRKTLEAHLRPNCFSEFPGQEKVKQKLQVFLGSAQKREKSLDHVLISGPPGLGKTTLSHILATQMKAPLVVTSGPALQHKGDLAAILTGLKPKSFLFIDEVHRIPIEVEEYLYSAMEDFHIDIFTGEGLGAQSLRFPLVPFTLVGATTRLGLLKSPFRARFGIVETLSFYTLAELVQVLKRSASLLEVQLDESALAVVAERSRGTPRVANRLLKRVRDYIVYKDLKQATASEIVEVMVLLEVDDLGLDALDRKYLEVLALNFQGGPAGIDSLAAVIQEESDTLQELCEPYMLQMHLIQKTARGRVLTEKGRQHLMKSGLLLDTGLKAETDSHLPLFEK